MNYLYRLLKISQMPDFMKIRALGAELFHADRRGERQRDMTQLRVAFHNFASAPKNCDCRENFQYASKYLGKIFPAVSNTGVISAC